MKSLFLCLLLLGCTSPAKKVDFGVREYLFPNGMYEHAIQLNMKTKSGDRTHSFHGVVQLAPSIVVMSALSPFGTTVFRLQENRATREVKFENFISALEPYEDHIQKFYSLIRVILTAPLDFKKSPGVELTAKDENGFPKRLKVQSDGEEAIVDIQKYDTEKIPREVQVRHPQFQIQIEVESYELTPPL